MDKKKYLFKRLNDLKTVFFQTSLKKKLLISVLIIVIGWFTISAVFSANSKQPQYQTQQVRRGNIIATLSESGNVSSTNETNVSSPTNGIIEEVYVKNSDEVSAGDNLFKAKSTATPAEQTSAYASLLSAQNNLNAARAKLNSLQSTLFKANQTFVKDRGVSSPTDQEKADPRYIEENADWLQAEADYKNQQGVIAQAQAALNSAGLALAATQNSIVTAPISGTIANLSAAIGSSVTTSSNNSSSSSSNSSSSSSSSSGGSAVLVISNFRSLTVKVQASEVDVPKIKTGQKATITLDALPDKTFVGRVNSIDAIGTSSSGVVTYNVYINFVAPSAEIKPGMTASAIIQTDKKENILTVPTSAIQTTNGQSFVRVQKNGNITQTQVETGISSDSDTEITSGLSEGDTIITSSVNKTGSQNGQNASPFSGNRGFGGGGNVIFRGGGR